VSFESDYVRGAGPDLFRVLIEVEPFDTVAESALQRAVARYLERASRVASPGLAEWIGSFQLLAPGADFDTAFASLSPEQYGASTLTGIDTQRQYLRGLTRRMDALRARRWLGEVPESVANVQLAMAGSTESILALGAAVVPRAEARKKDATWGVWLGALGQWGEQDPSDGFSGFDYSMGGGSLGVDRAFGDEFIGGLNVGYGYSGIEQEGGRGRGDINAVQVSAYGSWLRERGYVDWVLGYARQRYDNRRNVVVDPMSQTASSEHDANVFSAALGGGYRFDVAKFGLEPFARLSYLLLDEEGFSESGAGAANLRVEPRTTNSLVSELGVRAARGYELGRSRLVPYLSAAWKYDYDIDDRTIVSGLVGAPGTAFPLDGRSLDRNAALVGAGVLYFRSGWSASLEYLGEFRGDYQANGIFARFDVSF
jgi:outer membrane autotransporter protein